MPNLLFQRFLLFLLLLLPGTFFSADEPVRGIIISCQTWGWEWGTDEMVETMETIKATGANWIAIHPYARIHRDGTVNFNSLQTASPPLWLTRPIAEAKRLGLKICIIPHLAPWRAGWGWRGEITFQDEMAWDRFFRTYTDFVTTLATKCGPIDGFSVGSELGKTTSRSDEWRKIIASVREKTSAPLTYGANWTEFDKISFWDSLDAIGLSAYFPLMADLSEPTAAELDSAWEKHLILINSVSQKWDRPVVFMELGYDKSRKAAYRPWEDGDGMDKHIPLQALCLDRALTAVENAPQVDGVFLWKWFPGNPTGENFLLQTPPMQKTIAAHWKE
jgi:hypothetical protein